MRDESKAIVVLEGDPYRSIADVPKRKTIENGLIRYAYPRKPHGCKPPGFWKRFFYLLTGRYIAEKSLWRCSYCGQVFELEVVDCSDGVGGGGNSTIWSPRKIDVWLAGGGSDDFLYRG